MDVRCLEKTTGDNSETLFEKLSITEALAGAEGDIFWKNIGRNVAEPNQDSEELDSEVEEILGAL